MSADTVPAEVPELIYRPNKFDDWGMIRTTNGDLFAVVRRPLGEDEANEHRRRGTDPFETIARALMQALADRTIRPSEPSLPAIIRLVWGRTEAPSSIGIYGIDEQHGDDEASYALSLFNRQEIGFYDTRADCEHAAQADLEARVRACHVASTSLPDAEAGESEAVAASFQAWWTGSGRAATYDHIAQQAAFAAWCEQAERLAIVFEAEREKTATLQAIVNRNSVQLAFSNNDRIDLATCRSELEKADAALSAEREKTAAAEARFQHACDLWTTAEAAHEETRRALTLTGHDFDALIARAEDAEAQVRSLEERLATAGESERNRLFDLYERDLDQFAVVAKINRNLRTLPAQPASPLNVPVRSMTDAELDAEEARCKANFDARGEHGGSPGESAWERGLEIDTERKRRAAQPGVTHGDASQDGGADHG